MITPFQKLLSRDDAARYLFDRPAEPIPGDQMSMATPPLDLSNDGVIVPADPNRKPTNENRLDNLEARYTNLDTMNQLLAQRIVMLADSFNQVIASTGAKVPGIQF